MVNSQHMLPELHVKNVRQRVNKAYNLYTDNLKIYQRLSNTKSTIPSLEKCNRENDKRDKLLERLSQFQIKKRNTDESSSLRKRVDPLVKLDKIRDKYFEKTQQGLPVPFS